MASNYMADSYDESSTDCKITDYSIDSTNTLLQSDLWEYVNSYVESSTDCEIIDYSIDSTNTRCQSDLWEYAKPAVLSLEGVSTNSNKDIVDSTSPIVASNDKATELDEKTTKTTKSVTTEKSNLSDKSKPILGRKSGPKRKELYDFISTTYTEVIQHNIAVGCLMERFCSGCDKIIPKNTTFQKCQDCGSPAALYRCLNCNEYSHHLYHKVNLHIQERCKPPSIFYCLQCNYKTTRHRFRERHFRMRHFTTMNKP